MRWVRVATAPEPIIQMWRQLLDDAGIPALVRQDSLPGGVLGVSPIPCRLMVPEDHEAEAKEILEPYVEENRSP